MTLKNKLQKIHWDTIEKIFLFLHENYGVKRSHISMHARMSYDKCVRYLDWMDERNFIVMEKDTRTGSIVIKLTPHGITFYNNVILFAKKIDN